MDLARIKKLEFELEKVRALSVKMATFGCGARPYTLSYDARPPSGFGRCDDNSESGRREHILLDRQENL